MAIEGVEQPEILEINETLRLRRYDGAADFAFAWYQDFSRTDLPIVIGVPEYRGRGVGRQVIQTLMDRGRQLGFPTLGVREIYDFNIASIRCFTACGFAPVARTDKGWRYEAKL